MKVADDDKDLKKAGSKTKREMEEKIKKSINSQFKAALNNSDQKQYFTG